MEWKRMGKGSYGHDRLVRPDLVDPIKGTGHTETWTIIRKSRCKTVFFFTRSGKGVDFVIKDILFYFFLRETAEKSIGKPAIFRRLRKINKNKTDWTGT
jgi:hypothetical protein